MVQKWCSKQAAERPFSALKQYKVYRQMQPGRHAGKWPDRQLDRRTSSRLHHLPLKPCCQAPAHCLVLDLTTDTKISKIQGTQQPHIPLGFPSPLCLTLLLRSLSPFGSRSSSPTLRPQFPSRWPFRSQSRLRGAQPRPPGAPSTNPLQLPSGPSAPSPLTRPSATLAATAPVPRTVSTNPLQRFAPGPLDAPNNPLQPRPRRASMVAQGRLWQQNNAVLTIPSCMGADSPDSWSDDGESCLPLSARNAGASSRGLFSPMSGSSQHPRGPGPRPPNRPRK